MQVECNIDKLCLAEIRIAGINHHIWAQKWLWKSGTLYTHSLEALLNTIFRQNWISLCLCILWLMLGKSLCGRTLTSIPIVNLLGWHQWRQRGEKLSLSMESTIPLKRCKLVYKEKNSPFALRQGLRGQAYTYILSTIKDWDVLHQRHFCVVFV